MNEDLILENDEPEEDNKDNGKLELGEISKNNSEQQEVNYLIIHNLKDENYTKSIKVILCGESRVGKTSLINRLCYGNYSDDVPTTTSIRHYDYFIKIEDFILRMQIWDISGQEKKELIIRDNFFETDYAIFIYSIDDNTAIYIFVQIFPNSDQVLHVGSFVHLTYPIPFSCLFYFVPRVKPLSE